MKASTIPELGAAAVGAGIATYGAYSAVSWARYGKVDPARHPRDELLDRFMPDPEVDDYHSVVVDAPPDLTLAAGRAMDILASPPVKAIMWLRTLPAMLRGKPVERSAAHGLIEETLSLGWGLLAEVPDREIVIGTYTQPWHDEVTFHSLPPDEYAGFEEPGWVKIAVSFAAEPIGTDRSLFSTRTRVRCTDVESRRKFRLYWAPMSAGIILIRYSTLPMVKRDAERRAMALAGGVSS